MNNRIICITAGLNLLLATSVLHTACSTSNPVCELSDSWGISIPDRFDNTFANSSEWRDPRGHYPDLGNRSWSQVLISSPVPMEPTRLHTGYNSVTWEYRKSRAQLTVSVTEPNSDENKFTAMAELKDPWPTIENRIINRVNLKSVNFTIGDEIYFLEEGFFHDVRLSDDNSWISGKFSATLRSSHSQNNPEHKTKTVSGSFRGGFHADCEHWLSRSKQSEAQVEECKPFRFLIKDEKLYEDWRLKLPECKDVVDSSNEGTVAEKRPNQ